MSEISPFSMSSTIKRLEKMRKISKIADTPAILVTSGKGGVGKTLVSANIALKLSQNNKRVGLIDCDLRSPNLTYILNIQNKHLKQDIDQSRPPELNRLVEPYQITPTLEIFSTEHFLERTNHYHESMILFGEVVRSLIDQSVYAVRWNNPDIFVMDSDPSTSDVLIELTLIFRKYLSAVVVTTNDISSIFDCERTIDALALEKIKILGILGNMIWNNEDDRIRNLSKMMDVPYLGYIPYRNIIRLNNNQGIAEIPNYIIDFTKITQKIMNQL
ncbi:MAG: P-loop NTPase [Thermoplasmata archaeon]